MICIQVSQKTPHQVTYTLKYRHSCRNLLNATIFLSILEVFYVSDLENKEEYAEFGGFFWGKKRFQTVIICHQKVIGLPSDWPHKGPKNLLDIIQEWQDLWVSCGRKHKSQHYFHSELTWRKTMCITDRAQKWSNVSLLDYIFYQTCSHFLTFSIYLIVLLMKVNLAILRAHVKLKTAGIQLHMACVHDAPHHIYPACHSFWTWKHRSMTESWNSSLKGFGWRKAKFLMWKHKKVK